MEESTIDVKADNSSKTVVTFNQHLSMYNQLGMDVPH